MSKMPSERFRVIFCDKCGHDNMLRSLARRHFSGGSLCVGGKLKVVIYKRDDTTIRWARNDEI